MGFYIMVAAVFAVPAYAIIRAIIGSVKPIVCDECGAPEDHEQTLQALKADGTWTGGYQTIYYCANGHRTRRTYQSSVGRDDDRLGGWSP